MASHNHDREWEVIGLIPAGGQATRISPLPGSKELYPIGFRDREDGSLRPKVVSHYLLEKMRLAGICKAYFVLRAGKWDIPAYFGDGKLLDMHLGYLVVGSTLGVPYTLDRAYPFVKNAVVAVGFPDILFQPDDAFKHLLTRLSAAGADVVINLLPFEHAHKGGMVDFDADGRVRSIVEKPTHSNLRYSWCAAVWKPTFTEFMHQYLAVIASDRSLPPREIPLGDTIQAAIDNGLRVEAEVFDAEPYLDIGTPEDLVKAVRHFATWEPTIK
jgi:glucose-1-phosphate thymidylyltransferase